MTRSGWPQDVELEFADLSLKLADLRLEIKGLIAMTAQPGTDFPLRHELLELYRQSRQSAARLTGLYFTRPA